jgi:WD40 repeat protein
MFAAVNLNAIHVYNTYTYELMHTLRGHNGKVHSLHWTGDDQMLMSAGKDGALYQWNLADGKREDLYVERGTRERRGERGTGKRACAVACIVCFIVCLNVLFIQVC